MFIAKSQTGQILVSFILVELLVFKRTTDYTLSYFMVKNKPQKLIVIVGPTASGKSALAIKLARQLKAEIISADSRQVYHGLDIGSGKVSKREQRLVPHHLIDVASDDEGPGVA